MSAPSNRRCRRAQNHEAVDRISSLPDTILSHILFFVPTKSAVKTSILSKRWKYVWTKVPALDFTEMPCAELSLQQKISFRSFVDRVLVHNAAYAVQRLRFDLSKGDGFYLKSWLSLVARREIHTIYIWLSCSDPVSLPAKFLFSERLVNLTLVGHFVISDTLSLHLPNLKTAHFLCVELPNNDFIRSLVSASPLLKELCLVQCKGINSPMHVESPTLEWLRIVDIMIKSKPSHPSIVIKAPNLNYLHLEECINTDVNIISELTLLVEASLDILHDDIEDALELVRQVSGVRTLRLGNALCYGDIHNPPVFENLTTLEFDSGENVYQLLQCAPQLKTLVFEQVSSKYHSSFESKPFPTCLSCLESVEFRWFYGTEDEIALVAYLLMASPVLKKMEILVYALNTDHQMEVYERLFTLPMSSAACRLRVGRCNDFDD